MMVYSLVSHNIRLTPLQVAFLMNLIHSRTISTVLSGITCDPPFIPKNGAARIKKQSHFGTIVTFTCDPGYVLEGSRSIRCQADGNWNGTEPICKGKGQDLFGVS